MATFKKGDYIKVLSNKHLYWGAGNGFKYSRYAVKKGAILKVKDGPRSSQNKAFYRKGSSKPWNDKDTWIDVLAKDGKHGWICVRSTIAKTSSRKLTNLDGKISGVTPDTGTDIKFYVAGKELKLYPLTQDENGLSHKGLRYATGVLQYALDFGSMKVDDPFTCSDDCSLEYRSENLGNYLVVRLVNHPEFKIMPVHVYKHFSTTIGKVCKAGKTICKIAPYEYNGHSAVHLHMSARKNDKAYKIRNLIYS